MEHVHHGLHQRMQRDGLMDGIPLEGTKHAQSNTPHTLFPCGSVAFPSFTRYLVGAQDEPVGLQEGLQGRQLAAVGGLRPGQRVQIRSTQTPILTLVRLSHRDIQQDFAGRGVERHLHLVPREGGLVQEMG
jgi:hypothetical protein